MDKPAGDTMFIPAAYHNTEGKRMATVYFVIKEDERFACCYAGATGWHLQSWFPTQEQAWALCREMAGAGAAFVLLPHTVCGALVRQS